MSCLSIWSRVFIPGPHYHENFFTFMNWNLNSLAKKEFERVQQIEAHNSIYKYDLISLCETSLNDSMDIPDPLMNDYTFIQSHGLFYNNSFPFTPRHDLSWIFFTVSYIIIKLPPQNLQNLRQTLKVFMIKFPLKSLMPPFIQGISTVIHNSGGKKVILHLRVRKSKNYLPP